jgi:hypothetical protein
MSKGRPAGRDAATAGGTPLRIFFAAHAQFAKGFIQAIRHRHDAIAPASLHAPQQAAVDRALQCITRSGHKTGTDQSDIQKITEGDIQ